MDKLGPLARTAEDCGLVLAAIAGPDPADPSALDRPLAYPDRSTERKRYRLGMLKGTLEKTQPEVRRNFEESLRVLRDFADLEEGLELPGYPYDAMASIVLDAEAASAFEPLFESGRITELTAPEDRIGGYAGQVVLAKDYIRALRARRPAAAALDALLGRVDAVVAPTLPTVAWPIDAAFDKVYPDYPGGGEHRRGRQPVRSARPLSDERHRRRRAAHQPPAHRTRAGRERAARHRPPLPAAHEFSPAGSTGIVTRDVCVYIS
jgi:aspartyl-tRNA(Asn)/glutamyl-tRNA(Gln) amidotransferase subunit A